MQGALDIQTAEPEKESGEGLGKLAYRAEAMGNGGRPCPASPNVYHAVIALQVTHCERTARGTLALALTSDRDSAAAFFS